MPMSSNVIPTDSVLRRHYEASHAKQVAKNIQSQGKGGLLTWLKRIFS